MKTLPSLREKKRYIVFETTPQLRIKRKELLAEILNSACSLFGDVGLSEMNLLLISYDGRYGIIRCALNKTQETRAVLACIHKIGEARVSILVLGISGTIKGAREKFIKNMLMREESSSS